ncbi:MAG TPA: hypothetical protein VN495_03625 [Candidatus Paceibacterota bacterium]|nr:hypothetical protein [Candidatus Paceibacterota bacterium]
MKKAERRARREALRVAQAATESLEAVRSALNGELTHLSTKTALSAEDLARLNVFAHRLVQTCFEIEEFGRPTRIFSIHPLLRKKEKRTPKTEKNTKRERLTLQDAAE